MAWWIISGICIGVIIIAFLIRKYSFQDDNGEAIGHGIVVGLCIFIGIIMTCLIIFSLKYTDQPVISEKFEIVESTMYDLEELQMNKYVVINTKNHTISFMYYGENKLPILIQDSSNKIKIYSDVKGEPARVSVQKRRPYNKFVQTLSSDWNDIVYIIYLPTETNILVGGSD